MCGFYKEEAYCLIVRIKAYFAILPFLQRLYEIQVDHWGYQLIRKLGKYAMYLFPIAHYGGSCELVGAHISPYNMYFGKENKLG